MVEIESKGTRIERIIASKIERMKMASLMILCASVIFLIPQVLLAYQNSVQFISVEAFIVNIIKKSHLLKESEMIEDILVSKKIINMICEISDNVGKVYAVTFWSQHSISCFQSLTLSELGELSNFLSYDNCVITVLVYSSYNVWIKHLDEKSSGRNCENWTSDPIQSESVTKSHQICSTAFLATSSSSTTNFLWSVCC
ncbi:CLUMA_CG001120, isoform A [Clunio marinus]|uniref:CLUMA_CG001120, isoform A n=1 Tax=Clunio marinus TaxID=568069 RepID=A0A1J1HLI8_9DIPT|nr:CLUMA_CG001120, isoform A [Clunio marinus]